MSMGNGNKNAGIGVFYAIPIELAEKITEASPPKEGTLRDVLGRTWAIRFMDGQWTIGLVG